MPKCSFCLRQYEFPYGLTFVLSDGKILYFCSSKCRKNYELGRIGKKIKWVKKKKKERQETKQETPKIKKHQEEEKIEKETEKKRL